VYNSEKTRQESGENPLLTKPVHYTAHALSEILQAKEYGEIIRKAKNGRYRGKNKYKIDILKTHRTDYMFNPRENNWSQIKTTPSPQSLYSFFKNDTESFIDKIIKGKYGSEYREVYARADGGNKQVRFYSQNNW
jgi:hypothetical protein